MSRRAPRAADRTDALAGLMQRIYTAEVAGTPVPCVQPVRGHWWLSDDREASEAAAHACAACPVLDTCADYVTNHPEPAGVWAGRVPKPTKEND